MRKKFLSRLVLLGLSAAITFLSTTGIALAFQDVPADKDYATAIDLLKEKGIAVGIDTDNYAPDSSLTLAQLVTFLGRIAEAKVDQNATWPSNYMSWAASFGLLQNNLSENKALTASEANSILNTYCGKLGIGRVTVTPAGSVVTRGEAAIALASIAVSSPDTVRETRYGKVQGYLDTEKKAVVWKSIPYGQAERWAAPTAPTTWSGVLNCTTAGEKSLQCTDDGAVGTEDCLKLDIYAPQNAKDLPVFFFIHGGNNQTGSADAELNGETLVNKANCVFVSVDFRLGALGFNPLPALNTGNPLEDSGNYALLDIAQALDWVAENIAAFGGDGSNITISGFSAGGRDVIATLISPIFKGKYQQAISFSGSMTVADEADSIKVFAKNFAPLAVEDGKQSSEDAAYAWLQTDGKDVREWLLSLSGERVARAFGSAFIRMAIFPHLYTDGTVLPKEGFNTTKYADVPVMMVTGTNEFSMLGIFSTQGDERDFVLKYGGQLYEWANAEANAVKMREQGYSAPIYSLAIDFGNDTDLCAIPGLARVGAFHGIFVNLIDQYNRNNEGTAGKLYQTDAGLQLSDALCAYIGNFIRTGDPNSTTSGVKWAPWSAKGENALYFGTDTESADIRMVDRHLSCDEVIAEIEADDTIPADRKEYLLQNVLNGRWFSDELDEHFGTPSLWVK